jgi:hypothetical protein
MLQGLDEIVAHLYPDHTTQKPIYILWLILHQTIPQSNETLNPKQKLLATTDHTGGTCMTPCTSTLLALVVGRPSSEEGGCVGRCQRDEWRAVSESETKVEVSDGRRNQLHVCLGVTGRGLTQSNPKVTLSLHGWDELGCIWKKSSSKFLSVVFVCLFV